MKKTSIIIIMLLVLCSFTYADIQARYFKIEMSGLASGALFTEYNFWNTTSEVNYTIVSTNWTTGWDANCGANGVCLYDNLFPAGTGYHQKSSGNMTEAWFVDFGKIVSINNTISYECYAGGTAAYAPDYMAVYASIDNTTFTKVYERGSPSSGVGFTTGANITVTDNGPCLVYNYTNFNSYTSVYPVSFVNPTPNNADHNNIQAVINISIATPSSLSLYFDQNNPPTTLLGLATNSLFLNRTTNAIATGTYYYYGTTGTSNTSIQYWTYDIGGLNITLNGDNFYGQSNSTISRIQKNYNLSINFTDDIQLYGAEVNITNSSNATKFYLLNITFTGTLQTLLAQVNFSTWSLGTYKVYIGVADSHTLTDWTARAITIDDKSAKPVLTIETKEKNLIAITSDTEAKIRTTEEKDRIKDEWTFTDPTPKTVVYTLHSDGNIRYIDNPLHKAWFVITNPGTLQGNWRDFDEADYTPDVKQVDKNTYTITYKDVRDSLSFSSIGGLNQFNVTYQFTLASLTPFNFEMSLGGCSLYNGSQEFDRVNMSANQSCINNILAAGCSCPGCLIVGSNCRIPLNASNDVNASFYMKILNNSYSYGIDNCSNSFGIPSNATAYNFSFLDTNSNSVNVNLTAQITGTLNYTNTARGKSNYQLCTYPNWLNLNSDMTLQYLDSLGASYIDTYANALFDNITNNINLYTTLSTSTITFTAIDIGTKNPIGGAIATMYGLVGGVYVVLSSQATSISGKVVFNYIPSTPYRFLFTASNYQDYPFSYPTIIDTAVNVPMTRISFLNTSQDYEKISLAYTTQFYNGDNNFTFLIASPYNELLGYGYTLTYPNGAVNNVDNLLAGGLLTSPITITSTNPFDNVYLNYYYTTATGTKNFNYSFSIINSGLANNQNYSGINPLSNNTMMSVSDKTYGLDILTRILIVTLITIFVVGIAYMIGRGIMGLVLGGFIWTYFTYTGFISIWFILFPIMILLLLLARRTEGSGY